MIAAFAVALRVPRRRVTESMGSRSNPHEMHPRKMRNALPRFAAVLAVVLLFGCGGDGPTAPSGPGGGPAGGSPGGGGNPIPGPGLTLTLGTLRLTGAQDASCPTGERCQEFELAAPGWLAALVASSQ